MIRALNAALCIDGPDGELESKLKPTPTIPCLVIGPNTHSRASSCLSSPVEVSGSEWMGPSVPKPLGDVQRVEGSYRMEGWEDVVRWIREWDQPEYE